MQDKVIEILSKYGEVKKQGNNRVRCMGSEWPSDQDVDSISKLGYEYIGLGEWAESLTLSGRI